MTDRLTDDEIAELRHLHAIATDRALGAFTRSNALEKMTNMLTWRSSSLLSLLDEIEERRRAERAKAIEEATGCEPCMEVGRYVEAHAETADGVFVCKECFDACKPERKDGGA